MVTKKEYEIEWKAINRTISDFQKELKKCKKAAKKKSIKDIKEKTTVIHNLSLLVKRHCDIYDHYFSDYGTELTKIVDMTKKVEE